MSIVKKDLCKTLKFLFHYLIITFYFDPLSRCRQILKMAFHLFFQLGFTPCKAEQPLQGMELQEKEAQKEVASEGPIVLHIPF